MSPRTERRLLQLAVAAASLVPLSIGALGIFGGPSILEGVIAPAATDLDSHFRYLSGLLLGIGLVYLASLPRIERHRERFRLLCAVIVVGGFGRLLSLLLLGVPSAGHLFGLGMELVVVPAITLWQARLARRFGRHSG